MERHLRNPMTGNPDKGAVLSVRRIQIAALHVKEIVAHPLSNADIFLDSLPDIR